MKGVTKAKHFMPSGPNHIIRETISRSSHLTSRTPRWSSGLVQRIVRWTPMTTNRDRANIGHSVSRAGSPRSSLTISTLQLAQVVTLPLLLRTLITSSNIFPSQTVSSGGLIMLSRTFISSVTISHLAPVLCLSPNHDNCRDGGFARTRDKPCKERAETRS